MNRTRFYEILQAHKRGEDLKQFVPTNAPEASLINDLTGGSGGGSVEVPSGLFNNPNISNVYYGMPMNGKTKIKMDLKSYFNAMCISKFNKTLEEMLIGPEANFGDFKNEILCSQSCLIQILVTDLNTSYNYNSNNNTRALGIIQGYHSSGSNQTFAIEFGYAEGSGTTGLMEVPLDYNAVENSDAQALYESITNAGQVEIDFSSLITEDYFDDYYSEYHLYTYTLVGLCDVVDLNKLDKVDWIEFQ